jgi:hypothetical protein
MSNIHHLKLPTVAAWQGRPLLDAVRTPAYSIGERVVVDGIGPGEVVDVYPASHTLLVYVTLDDVADGPLPFDSRELTREPTI